MGYKEKMLVLSIKEKVRFLEELRAKYGGDIKLRDLQHKIQVDSKQVTIENCRFTGVDGSDSQDEFTGTIEEVVKDFYNMGQEELTNKADWLLEVFTNGEEWVSYDGNEYGTVKCVPVDRPVDVVEVSKHLEKLAKKSVTWNKDK